MKTTQEMIAVMQAYVDGKKVQFSHINCNIWADSPTPSWDWRACDYRIKPAPFTLWFIRKPGDEYSGPFTEKEKNEMYIHIDWRWIKLMEVEE